ncbi:MAG: hypothetical protein K8T90_15835 [Planctomycetes bacterium]|nr:hypothetical protein [Planctomycetota bacterium]
MHGGIPVAVLMGVLVGTPLLSGAAFADAADFSEQMKSDLAAAMAPLVAEGSGAAGARARDPGIGGLRCWFGLEPRAADPFDGFARPVTNLQFHHPFIWNEIRPVFVQHWFPKDSLLAGGDLRAYACQIHAKITDDLQFTAYKDGYVHFDSKALPDDTGFADLALGFKYKLWQNLDVPAIFTVGLGYETTTGDEEVLEGGHGDLFDLFGSYARKLGDVNLITTAGFILPLDADEATRAFHWHVHFDIPATANFSPLLEFNLFHYMSNAERNAGLGPTVPLGFEGFDYTNLGSDDVDGNTVASMALGFRWALSDDVSFGAAYEFPITDREDVIDKRITVDLVFRF